MTPCPFRPALGDAVSHHADRQFIIHLVYVPVLITSAWAAPPGLHPPPRARTVPLRSPVTRTAALTGSELEVVGAWVSSFPGPVPVPPGSLAGAGRSQWPERTDLLVFPGRGSERKFYSTRAFPGKTSDLPGLCSQNLEASSAARDPLTLRVWRCPLLPTPCPSCTGAGCSRPLESDTPRKGRVFVPASWG